MNLDIKICSHNSVLFVYGQVIIRNPLSAFRKAVSQNTADEPRAPCQAQNNLRHAYFEVLNNGANTCKLATANLIYYCMIYLNTLLL